MSPCGSYTHGETVFEEFTTVDQYTRNIAGHLQMLHLRESTELKSESDLILMRAGKSIFIITLFEKGGGSTSISHMVVSIFRVRLLFFFINLFPNL